MEDAAREKIVGWYHTGPRLRESDLDIQELMSNYCPNPILVVCEVEVHFHAKLDTMACHEEKDIVPFM